MIKSFAHKGLEKFFRTGSQRGINPDHSEKLRRQLFRLDAAVSAKDMDIPGWKLHRLSGSLKDHWSVWVSGNWRLTFKFECGHAEIVNYQDYH
jgi:toxin HigB-1